MLLKLFPHKCCSMEVHIVQLKDATAFLKDFCHEGKHPVFTDAEEGDTGQSTFYMNHRIHCCPKKCCANCYIGLLLYTFTQFFAYTFLFRSPHLSFITVCLLSLTSIFVVVTLCHSSVYSLVFLSVVVTSAVLVILCWDNNNMDIIFMSTYFIFNNIHFTHYDLYGE